MNSNGTCAIVPSSFRYVQLAHLSSFAAMLAAFPRLHTLDVQAPQLFGRELIGLFRVYLTQVRLNRRGREEPPRAPRARDRFVHAAAFPQPAISTIAALAVSKRC